MTSIKIKRTLSECGIKTTPQRIAVYQALHELGHATAEQITSRVHATLPSVTVGTIYNALECLWDNGLISKIHTQGNKMLFDISTHDHHHIFCEDTGMVVDFGDERLTEIIRNYVKESDTPHFDLTKINVQLTGRFRTNTPNNSNPIEQKK